MLSFPPLGGQAESSRRRLVPDAWCPTPGARRLVPAPLCLSQGNLAYYSRQEGAEAVKDIPRRQHAVQLVGPDELRLNTNKEVYEPGPYHILCRVKAVGLCFSDLKLLKQYSTHVRKSEVIAGVDRTILEHLPSYVPGDTPTVPGHEPTVEIAAIGSKVSHVQLGERYFVQADWRWLRTATSNGAFGYNFEGALQEYVLLDERIVFPPDGESMLMAASDPSRSMSAYALVEPWACVEDAYGSPERTTLLEAGRMLVVTEHPLSAEEMGGYLSAGATPAHLTVAGDGPPVDVEGMEVVRVDGLDSLDDGTFDDVLYLGSNKDVVERLFGLLGKNGVINIVQRGGSFGDTVRAPLGLVHYGGIRITGTAGDSLSAGLQRIPRTGEIRSGERIHIVGAGGPMGVMHVIRNLCQGVAEIEVCGSDLSAERLTALDRLARPTAEQRGARYRSFPAADKPAGERWSYITLMAPVPALVAQAVGDCSEGGIINIFAGIPADVWGEIDLDAYLAHNLYMIGTSGSLMRDMKVVLGKIAEGSLDTNVSVAAVSGLDGAVEGIRAVEKQLIAGKILVYPACRGLGLTPLIELENALPGVAEKLDDGVWTAAAETALLEHFSA